MNTKELRIYTCLTHPTSPESYRIEDDGTKLYVMECGALVYLEGEGLDKMTGPQLYAWYQTRIRDWRLQQFQQL